MQEKRQKRSNNTLEIPSHIANQEQACTKCKQIKQYKDFYVRSDIKYRHRTFSECKECFKARMKRLNKEGAVYGGETE